MKNKYTHTIFEIFRRKFHRSSTIYLSKVNFCKGVDDASSFLHFLVGKSTNHSTLCNKVRVPSVLQQT